MVSIQWFSLMVSIQWFS